MDRSKLQIGTYILAPYARTEQHIKDLAACGINFVVGVNADTAMLDRFEKYGVGAVVNGVVPGWWGGDGANSGTMQQKNPLEHYKTAAAAFEDHPAIWGIDIGDEPSAADFPHYGAVLKTVDAHFPNQFAFLNIYPSYGWSAQNTAEEVRCQLGAVDYASYMEQYCMHVPSDYISYDHYLYSSSAEAALNDLQTVSALCRKTGRSLWIVLQVNSNGRQYWSFSL